MNLNIKIPSRHFKATRDIINKATPDHRGLCIGALAIREVLAPLGVQSLYVTPDTVRFNLPTKVKGKTMMVRYIHLAPAQLTRAAHLFDAMGRKHGSDYARKHSKPFSFILQGRDGWAQTLVVQPRGKNRKKRVTRKRAATTHERVTRCARRYHPLEAYRVRPGAQAA